MTLVARLIERTGDLVWGLCRALADAWGFLDGRDWLGLAGLAAVIVGLWWERPSLALIVPGVLVVGCVVATHLRGGK